MDKFKMLYSENVEEKKDPKFDRLVSLYDRVQKAISQQHRTLDYLVRKVNKLIVHDKHLRQKEND